VVDYADDMSHDKPLHRMFTAVPRRYDMVNHVITWGLDRRWRWQTARECLVSQPKRVLDLCCGTGDLAISIAQLAKNRVEVTGTDFSQPMLEIAVKKTAPLAGESKIAFTYGDVAGLPFPNEHFDCIGISFAFRNLTYKNPLSRQYLAEILRLLKAGGRCVIVETGQPRGKLIRKLFHLYLRWLVPMLGYLLSGNRSAYHYLAESAARFYTGEELKELLLTAGFDQVAYRPLFLGVAAIYVAVK
jgi:demethylmenaquinone methyltransferase/2-methoxy-6-polyprenyl-1,4-benzoquinol methylase